MFFYSLSLVAAGKSLHKNTSRTHKRTARDKEQNGGGVDEEPHTVRNKMRLIWRNQIPFYLLSKENSINIWEFIIFPFIRSFHWYFCLIWFHILCMNKFWCTNGIFFASVLIASRLSHSKKLGNKFPTHRYFNGCCLQRTRYVYNCVNVLPENAHRIRKRNHLPSPKIKRETEERARAKKTKHVNIVDCASVSPF